MRLNDLKPAAGAKQVKMRLGRGMGSGLGKTCGFGHKGQKARSGCSRRAGFEGGQTPLYRRLPKFGFHSPKQAQRAQITLTDLAKLELPRIDLKSLIASNVVPRGTRTAKVVLSGQLPKAVKIAGDIALTAGARQAILAAGGEIAAPERKCASRRPRRSARPTGAAISSEQ